MSARDDILELAAPRIGDAIVAVVLRFVPLALLQALPVAAFCAVAALFDSREVSTGAKLAGLTLAPIAVLGQAWFLGLAPVPLIRGEPFHAALRAANRTSRGHRLLALAPTLFTLLLVGGGVFSLVAADALPGPASFIVAQPQRVALAIVVLFASLLAAPAVHGFLTLAAWRIASGTKSGDDSAAPRHETA